MPKASDYNNGIIYKFVCNDVDVPNTYVGSTVHSSNENQSTNLIATTKTAENTIYTFIGLFVQMGGGITGQC